MTDHTPTSDEAHVCKPGAGFYFCPTAGETESDCHGGFDICCDRPDLHQPLPMCGRCGHAAGVHGVYGCHDDCGCPERPDLTSVPVQASSGTAQDGLADTGGAPHACSNCDGVDPESCLGNPDRPPAPADAALRDRIGAAIRDAARNCDSKCGLTEDRCAAAHPIQVEYWTDDAVSGVAGPIDALTDAVLTAVQPERCCSCGSNDVVYHNFREQPFCGPCADGDRPAMHRAAEQQIREAAGRLLYPVGARVLDALGTPLPTHEEQ